MANLFGRILTAGLLAILSLAANAASYEEFAKNKRQLDGYFPLYIDDTTGQVFVDVVRLDEPFLFQSSLPFGVGSNDIGLDRGQLGDTRIVQFEQVGNKVLLRQLNTYYRADSDNAAERKSVREAFTNAVIWGFKAEVSDDDHLIIDYTPFLLSDIHGVGERLKSRKQGNFSVDKSRSAAHFARTKAFPKNTELEALISFKGSGAGEYLRQVAADNNNITVHMHHSLVELPDDNYQPREFHPYSGFWSVEYMDYATPIEEQMVKRFIPRHRLAKKDPSAAMSEAVEPIVYYLDPGAPEPVRSALLDGARWWNQAFEAAGYKDAYQVKMLPEDADPMDLRYNVIQWVHRSTRGWSYGASVIDPRTGEIIKGHVTLGSLRVRQDLLIAQGMLSPYADGNTDIEHLKEMALARIRQLSAHEVGHTLGIAHNFSASVDGRASVMDYPHPLIQLEGDELVLTDAYDTGIGEWDKHVVTYGYSDGDVDLAAIIKRAQDKGLGYMSDPDARPQSGAHPAGHLWDNGANPSEELERILQVRDKALSGFGVNTIAMDQPYSQLEELLVPVYYSHRFQTEAAVKAIAGVDYLYELRTDAEPYGAVVVPAEQQQAALEAMLKTLDPARLTLSEEILALIPPKAYGYYRTRESAPSNTGLVLDPVTMAEAAAEHSLKLLLNPQRLSRLTQQSARIDGVPTVEQVLRTLVDNTINQAKTDDLTGVVAKRLDQLVMEHILVLAYSDKAAPEVVAAASLVALELKVKLSGLNLRTEFTDPNKAHIFSLFKQVSNALESNSYTRSRKPAAMPPGSPI